MPNDFSAGDVHVSGQGDPLILVHGNASTHETWSGVVRHLAQDFQCISYDLRGHGPHPDSVEPYILDDLVDDLEEIRDRMALEAVHIVGHSLGSMISAAYAHRYPNRVITLTLMATPAGRTAEERAKVNDLAELVRKNGVRATLGTMVDSWYTSEFTVSNPQAIAHRLQQITTIDRGVFLNDLALYAETEIEDWLPEIRIPTLVMTGEFATGSGPRMSEIIHRRLPDSELKIFDGLKNGILTEIPDRVAEEVASFIRIKTNATHG